MAGPWVGAMTVTATGPSRHQSKPRIPPTAMMPRIQTQVFRIDRPIGLSCPIITAPQGLARILHGRVRVSNGIDTKLQRPEKRPIPVSPKLPALEATAQRLAARRRHQI